MRSLSKVGTYIPHLFGQVMDISLIHPLVQKSGAFDPVQHNGNTMVNSKPHTQGVCAAEDTHMAEQDASIGYPTPPSSPECAHRRSRRYRYMD